MSRKTVRARVAEILRSHRKNDPVSQVFDGFLVSLILLNVLAVILATIESFATKYAEPLLMFEIFSVIVFTIEYLSRIWTCVEDKDESITNLQARINYIKSPMALIDLAAILPFYLSFFISIDLRTLRMIRLLRIIKLGRYSYAMDTLMQVIKREFKVLASAVILLLVLMIIASTGIYVIESQVQPDKFGSIPQAMWWAMATLTTVGYGDVTPVTALGKFFAGSITILSMGMVALPAGILASSFSEVLRKRREQYRRQLLDNLKDGHLDEAELADLDKLRKQMDISKEDAEFLLESVKHRQNQYIVNYCPHCGKAINHANHSDE